MVGLTDSERAVAPPSRPDSSWTAADLEWARKRVEKKRKLRADLVAYAVISLALVGVWAITGFGYFWPGWVIGVWGLLLVLNASGLFYRRPVTDDDIEQELRNRR